MDCIPTRIDYPAQDRFFCPDARIDVPGCILKLLYPGGMLPGYMLHFGVSRHEV